MRELREILLAQDFARREYDDIVRQLIEILGIADITVAAVVAVHGASVPWGLLQADGITILPARRLPDLLQGLPPRLGPERVAWLADRARLRFHAAA